MKKPRPIPAMLVTCAELDNKPVTVRRAAEWLAEREGTNVPQARREIYKTLKYFEGRLPGGIVIRQVGVGVSE